MLLQFIETSLHIVRTKWYEKTQRKFAHLERGQGQTFRFTLCPLVEMVLLCFTQWQNYSCWQGPPEAQPWSQPDCSELHLSLLGVKLYLAEDGPTYLGPAFVAGLFSWGKRLLFISSLSFSCVSLCCCPLATQYCEEPDCISSIHSRQYQAYCWMPLKLSLLLADPASVPQLLLTG